MAIDVNEWNHHVTTARITLPANTNRAPGRKARWAAHVGNWHAEATTEKGALALVADGVAAFVTSYDQPEIIAYGGYTGVISQTVNTEPGHAPAWIVQTVHQAGHVSMSYCARDSVAEVIAETKSHLAHLATDWHSNASVHAGAAYLAGGDVYGYGQYGPDEFYRYAARQRAAKAAMDADHADYHTWATEHAHEFTVPRPADA
jgi:hypothetical protein